MVFDVVHRTWRFLQVLPLMLLPILGPLLCPDDHHLLRYYAAIVKVMRPVLHRIFMLLQPNGNKTVKEFLFELPGYSNTRYKKDFNLKERGKLDSNEPSESFDVTLLYKLLQLICGLPDANNAAWSLSGTLENSLKRMKDHRNVLAHEEISFTWDELQHEIADLEELCKIALEATALRSQQDLAAEVREMKEGMNDVLTGSIDLWEPYKDALIDLRNKQTAVLIREGRGDLRSLGKRLRILNPFAWLLETNYSHMDVEHIFTELILEGKGKVEMQNLLTAKLPSGELPDTIVISGTPGIGKTSLSRFLVHDWLSTNPVIQDLENVELLLPIELRHVCSLSVEQLVKDEVLPSVCKHLQDEDILSTLRSISVVWVLDGYDEATLETKQVIKDLLRKFPDSRVLITTRTEFTAEVELRLSDLHRCHMSVDIKGFSTDNVEKCTRKLIDVHVKNVVERQDVHDKFMKFSREYGLIKWEIFTVPLFLTMIVVLWLDDPDKLHVSERKSSTFLYTLIVDLIVNKMIVRESFQTLNQRKSLLQKKVNMFIDEIGKILWKDDLELSLQEYEVDYLEEKCNELGLPFKESMAPFFVFAEQATPTGVKEQYTIIHRTLKEFLSARAFCNDMITKEWDVMTTAGNWFTTTRDRLRQHEPSSSKLKDKFNLENLRKQIPLDIYQTYHRKFFAFSSINYFDNYFENFHCCAICHSFKWCDLKPGYYVQDEKGIPGSVVIRPNNYWCHIRDQMRGIQNVYIVGYLNYKKELNQKRAEQLAFMCFQLIANCFGDYAYWHYLMIEGEDSPFIEKLSDFMIEITWAFVDGRAFDSAKQLLHYSVPKSVFLHYCPSSSVGSNKFLLDCIEIFYKLPVEIHLDLRYFLIQPANGVECAREYLKILLSETSCSRLVTLRGLMDGETMKLLRKASDLRELSIRYCDDEIMVLVDVMEKLPNLQNVRLELNPNMYIGLELPILMQASRKLSSFTLVLPNIFSFDPVQVGIAVGQLCPYLPHVFLQGGVTEIDPGHLFAYLFYIVSLVKGVAKIELLIDIKGKMALLNQTHLLERVKVLLKKLSSNVILIIHVSTNGTVLREC